jgi:hypothetical protein
LVVVDWRINYWTCSPLSIRPRISTKHAHIHTHIQAQRARERERERQTHTHTHTFDFQVTLKCGEKGEECVSLWFFFLLRFLWVLISWGLWTGAPQKWFLGLKNFFRV